ncbi:DUF4158 domain-containing protein [Streptomyces variegatus]|uniref:DUF4158 domain-containing protein n=1 Tax=Streptomyces variegatus TaxID=284040 RepID=UPI003C2F9074
MIEAKEVGVRQEWSPEELLANWTLVDGDWDLVANKSGATRLGFSLLLKFFELEGRFPDVLEEVPPTAVDYVADLVKVPATDFAKYTLVGRSAEYHRKQIREALGFRPSTVADEKALAEWLAVEVCPVVLVEDRQREALVVECRARKIEPPGPTRVEKVLVAARGRWERTFCARTVGRLGEAGTAQLLCLVAEDNEAGTALLATLKRDPGAVGLDSLLTEITKLNDVRKLGLPDGLFADCSEKRWWPPGGRGRSRCTPRTSATRARMCGSRCSHHCAGPGRRRSGTPWSPWSTRSRSCRAAGGEAADGRVEEGPRQGGHPLQAGDGRRRQARRGRPPGPVPGGG